MAHGAEDPLLISKEAVAEVCPAFAEGCPYASSTFVQEWLVRLKRRGEARLCPGFGGGCPFKAVRDLEALRLELQKLPTSHGGHTHADGELGLCRPHGPAHAMLVEMLQLVHQTSLSVKATVGSDCPVFQTSCPFKNCVTSGGEPLVLELETRSWGFFIHDSHFQDKVLVGGLASGTGRSGTEEPPAAEGVAAASRRESEDGVGLARKLKLGTTEAHKAAESVHFVKEFIKGNVPRVIYAQMVVNLFYVYQAMEEELERCCDHPLIDDLHFPEELTRTEALAQDAEFFLGIDWREKSRPSKVTEEYVARIRKVAKESPELLIPHAYTRYLGDLSGGQLLKKAAVRGLKLIDDGSGVQFYTFRRIKDYKRFKEMYRARLDNLKADARTADRLVSEANFAFGLNTRMFQELDRIMGFSPASEPVRPPSAPKPAVPASITGAATATAAGACPFAALAASGVPMPADHPSLQASKPRGGRAGAELVPGGAGARVLLRALRRHPGYGLLVIAGWIVAVACASGFFRF